MIAVSRSNTLVLVPAWNEAASIASVVEEVLAAGLSPLVVSDGSTDRTALVAQRAGAQVLDLPINLGVGGALRAGFKVALASGWHAVVQVDADGQHPAHEIDDLIEAANKTDAHMVIGSRFTSPDTTMDVGRVRRAVMHVLAASASRATGQRITDATSGFRLIRGSLLQQFASTFPTNYLGDTYEAIVSAGRSGYRVVEVPAGLRSRVAGTSTASISQSVKFTLKGLAVAGLRLHQQIQPAVD
jgi:glycosyltransferase involved in cell wall biosynthesis